MVHLWASNRVAMMNVAAAVAAGGPPYFVGPLPVREPMPPSAI